MELPQNLIEAADKALQNLIPEKSKQRYDKAYTTFKKWQAENNVAFLNENFLLAYFQQLTLTVLNPFRSPEAAAIQDTDFAGPLVFCLTFGAFLLLSGKVHFSYIYGIGLMGCLSIWALLSLMSTAGVSLGTVVTVLGYCILPMVALSGINIVLSLQGYVGMVLTSVAIGWCSLSASKLFVTALAMDHQQPLVLYPCALLYGVFALITIF